MADFKIFKPLLLQQEGGWSNKVQDSGGETWEGISRKNYPKWSGWAIVDRIKASLNFPAAGWSHQQVVDLDHALRHDDALNDLVDSFYKCSQWDSMFGDLIANQSIADFLIDWGVNAGQHVPIKHAQQILGIVADGIIGSKTIAALNNNSTPEFFAQLQAARKQFYLDVVADHPEDKVFLSDWLERNASFKFSA